VKITKFKDIRGEEQAYAQLSRREGEGRNSSNSPFLLVKQDLRKISKPVVNLYFS